jgi:hypothetical protein
MKVQRLVSRVMGGEADFEEGMAQWLEKGAVGEAVRVEIEVEAMVLTASWGVQQLQQKVQEEEAGQQA